MLNALRHLRFGQSPRVNRQLIVTSAQRLTASKVWAELLWELNVSRSCVLNALRHLRFGQEKETLKGALSIEVLNALRHLRFGQTCAIPAA